MSSGPKRGHGRCKAPAEARPPFDVVQQAPPPDAGRARVAALRAERQMRRDHDATGLVERAEAAGVASLG
jgi:hypothetical protein